MRQWRFRWTVLLLIMASLSACRPVTMQPQAPTVTPSPSVPPTLLPSPSPTLLPTTTPTLAPTPVWPPPLAPPYTPTGDRTSGRIRGHLSYPSEFVPPLAVYAVATDGSRFYRVDTRPAPPGEPSYEIPVVEPGTYYVYAYPTWDEAAFAGAYSYLAACEAGHFPPPLEGCWEDPQHDLAPVEVQAAQAVEEINIYDWYGPSLPPPPGDTSGWPMYTNKQLAYRIRYPPHWEVRSERQGETTFGRPDVPEEIFASVSVTTGDPEELADQLIASLPPGDVVSREWIPFAGRNSLHLVLDLPDGRFVWWFVPRYELVYILHAVTDSGRGSFEQMVQTFAFQ